MEIIAKPDWMFAVPSALLERGCVNIIGFEMIKRAAAARWQRLRPSVCAHLENLLRRTLGPSDFFAEISDTAFLVSMPAAAPEESQLCCLRVAQELHSQQLGRRDLGTIEISNATRFEHGKLECVPLNEAALLALSVKSGLPAAGSLDAQAPAAPASMNGTDGQTAYVPLWDIKNEAITTYRCVGTEGSLALDDRPTQQDLKSAIGALLTRMAVGTKTLAASLTNGERFLLSLPIAYGLWCSPAVRMEVAAFCRSLSAELRPYMFFEISQLPEGVPQSRLLDLVGSLRPFCRGVAAELPSHLPSYSAYQGCGLHAISLPLLHGEVGTMTRDIAKLGMIARSLNVKSVIYDVPTVDLVLAAREHGVTAVASPCIGTTQREPSAISRLRLRDLQKERNDSRREGTVLA